MSAVMDVPAATGTRIAELTRDGVTLRLSVTDGQPWIALERWRKGETSCIAMPLSDTAFRWVWDRLMDMERYDGPANWTVLEP